MRNYGRNLSSVLLVSVVIYLRILPAAETWGIDGHHAICKITESLLSDEASKAVKDLLPEDLDSLCSWADQVRFKYPWSKPLHYINTPDDKCTYQYSRDCHDEEGEKGRCVDGAIQNYTSQLGNNSKTDNLTEALLFLSHFMGDIHQPMHVGHTTDEGGNTIELRWYNKSSSLHAIWDNLIIETGLKDYYDKDIEELIKALQENITGTWSDEVPTWEKCGSDELACPGKYASESIKLACNWGYKDAENNTVLGDDYFLSRWPIVETQLAKSGVRLAATLNRIFS